MLSGTCNRPITHPPATSCYSCYTWSHTYSPTHAHVQETFQPFLDTAGDKLVVVDFFTGACVVGV